MNFFTILTAAGHAFQVADTSVRQLQGNNKNILSSVQERYAFDSPSCKALDTYTPLHEDTYCFAPDQSIKARFSSSLHYLMNDPQFADRVEHLCTVLQERHGNYQLPIKPHEKTEFTLNAPTNSKGHDAHIHWNPKRKALYHELDGKVSKRAVSPAASLEPEISRALSAFSNPQRYTYETIVHHTDYDHLDNVRIAQEMNTTKEHLPEGTWSSRPFNDNMYASCIIDTDAPDSFSLAKLDMIAPHLAALQKVKYADSPYHAHLIPMNRTHYNPLLEEANSDREGLIGIANAALDYFDPMTVFVQMASKVFSRSTKTQTIHAAYIERNRQNDSLMQNAEKFRKALQLGQKIDPLELQAHHEQVALRFENQKKEAQVEQKIHSLKMQHKQLQQEINGLQRELAGLRT